MSKAKSPKAHHTAKRSPSGPGGGDSRPPRPAARQPLQSGGERNAKRSENRGDGRLWLYGHHAVEAALQNRRRGCLELRATRNALNALSAASGEALARRRLTPVIIDAEALAALVPPGSVHQGIALAVEPLDQPGLEDLAALNRPELPALIVVLDQVTDPHNVGAIIRSAAAFGAAAIVSTDRHSPPESAALAKSASGALETVPWVKVVNLARALETLAARGFWRIGLDGAAEKTLADIDLGERIVLVLGAEGAGLRHGTRDHCDVAAKLPISSAVESLNVSNAAAVALYEFARRRPPGA